MLENRQAILQSNRRVGRMFKSAYFALAEAKAIQNEWESYVNEALDTAKINEAYNAISGEIFGKVKPNSHNSQKTRRLFATAITPEGPVNYLETVLQDVQTLYVIKGDPGSGKATLIGNIARQSEILGLTTEAYHCSFVPQNIDIVVMPELATAVANLSEPVSFQPGSLAKLTYCKEVDLSSLLNQQVLSTYSEETASCKLRFTDAFGRAVNFLSQAKAEHDRMESFYVPAMNFAAINAKKDEILARILKYAEYQGN